MGCKIATKTRGKVFEKEIYGGDGKNYREDSTRVTFFTHALVTYTGVRVLGLEGVDVIWAYVFGVLIDLDHLIKIPGYIKRVGWKIQKHYNWRTSLQEPVALVWAALFSIAVKSVAPTVFLGAHIVLDYLVSYEKRPWWPFSGYMTRGMWLSRSDRFKEIVVATLFGCISLYLWLTPQ